MQVGYEKIAILTNISLHRVLSTLRPLSVINTVTPDYGKLVALITISIKRRSLLIAGDGR